MASTATGNSPTSAGEAPELQDAATAAARLGMPEQWGWYHTKGWHICIDGRNYGPDCLVTDPGMDRVARYFLGDLGPPTTAEAPDRPEPEQCSHLWCPSEAVPGAAARCGQGYAACCGNCEWLHEL